MKSNEFIPEAEVKPYRYEELQLDRAMEILNQYATQALPLLEQPIWRGIIDQDKPIILMNPSSGVRKSQNTTNHYTLLIDNSPYMKGWPKRSQSLICSTKWDSADSYGTAYAIFPLDNAKIAVCPSDDMWDTEVTLPYFDLHFYSVERLAVWLRNVMQISDDSWEAFARSVKSNARVAELCKESDVAVDQFIPILWTALSPKATGFKLLTIPQFIAAGLNKDWREVWIGDNVIAIREDLWKQFVDAQKAQVK